MVTVGDQFVAARDWAKPVEHVASVGIAISLGRVPKLDRARLRLIDGLVVDNEVNGLEMGHGGERGSGDLRDGVLNRTADVVVPGELEFEGLLC